MTYEERCKIIQRASKRREGIMEDKGREYSGERIQDVNANFTRNAEVLGVSYKLIWAVYFNKHQDSLMTFIKTGKVGKEGIIGRLDDMRNYLDILESLLIQKGEIK